MFVLKGRAVAYNKAMLEFLPKKIKDGLRFVNLQFVYEIRLRQGKPTTVNYKGTYRYLCAYGITDRVDEALVCAQEDVAETLYRAGERSVYSVEEQLKRGFLTAKFGERLGVAGEYVFEKGQPLCIRNVTSLCVRVPHEIVGCGENIYQKCLSARLGNLLISSPPGIGKTTILRDITRILSEKTAKNILICDERGELAMGDLGAMSDVLQFADKQTAFEAGIRAMRPDVIVTDELLLQDMLAVKRAIFSGVFVIASTHCLKYENLTEEFLNTFDYYVFLSESVIGEIGSIYGKNGELIG